MAGSYEWYVSSPWRAKSEPLLPTETRRPSSNAASLAGRRNALVAGSSSFTRNRCSISLQAASEEMGSSTIFPAKGDGGPFSKIIASGVRASCCGRQAAMHVTIFDRLTSEPPGARPGGAGEGVAVIRSEDPDSLCRVVLRVRCIHRGAECVRCLEQVAPDRIENRHVEIGLGKDEIAERRRSFCPPATGRACWRTTPRRTHRRRRAAPSRA